MRAKKSLVSLPRPKELKSNKLEDIQEFFRKTFEELDRQWRLLFQDIATIQVDGDGWIYFGGKNVTGSIRIGQSGTDWVVQHYIAGTYTERLKSSP